MSPCTDGMQFQCLVTINFFSQAFVYTLIMTPTNDSPDVLTACVRLPAALLLLSYLLLLAPDACCCILASFKVAQRETDPDPMSRSRLIFLQYNIPGLGPGQIHIRV